MCRLVIIFSNETNCGVLISAETPVILPSPPVAGGNYTLEVGTAVERNIDCLLQLNLFYVRPFNITSYRVTQGNELIELGEVTIGSNSINL